MSVHAGFCSNTNTVLSIEHMELEALKEIDAHAPTASDIVDVDAEEELLRHAQHEF